MTYEQVWGIILALAFYFLPTIICFFTKPRSIFLFMLLNGLFGWTGIGWLICLFSAIASIQNETNQHPVPVDLDLKTKIENANKLFELYHNQEIDLSFYDEKGVDVFKTYAKMDNWEKAAGYKLINNFSEMYLAYQKELNELTQDNDEIEQIEKRFNERRGKCY